MSTKTAKPPPAPVAALLSPFLWITERPDRFDVYSAGLLFLQLAIPSLRTRRARRRRRALPPRARPIARAAPNTALGGLFFRLLLARLMMQSMYQRH